jgi:DNA-binding MarR family transcriptional regulator
LPRVVPALRRLESAGLITVYDARTKRSYVPIGVGTDQREAIAEIAFVSQEDRAKPSAVPKKATRKAPSSRTQKKK